MFHLGDGDALLAVVQAGLGAHRHRLLAVLGPDEEAEPLLLTGYDGLAQSKDAPAERRNQALARIVDLYQQWGNSEQTEVWRKKQPVAVK